MEISTLKQKLLKALDSVYLNKLSLPEIHQVADILKKIASIDDNTYIETIGKIFDGMGKNPFPTPPTISDLKEEEANNDGV